jgi:hypothetical protein
MTTAILPDQASGPSYRSFSTTLRLCWIAAAAFGESLRLLAMSDRFIMFYGRNL